MTETLPTETAEATSVAGWLLRDSCIAGGLFLLLWVAQQWYQASAAILAAMVGAFGGFITAYVICYILHEWGHLIGARLTASHMPLNNYTNPGIGRFDPTAHSTRQFLALSWGGVAGYCLASIGFAALYFSQSLDWVAAGLIVGGFAFVTQSLAVDLPQIWKVMQGGDPLQINQQGATAEIILRRTWQTWIPLVLVLVVYNALR